MLSRVEHKKSFNLGALFGSYGFGRDAIVQPGNGDMVKPV